MVSSPRMSRYANHSSSEALYLWNIHPAKTYLANIEHLKVLLRNGIHDALTRRPNERWSDEALAVCPQHFRGKLERSPMLVFTLTFTRLEIGDLSPGIFTCSGPELSNFAKTNSISLQTEQDRRRLNVFFTRLLFCCFSEDTGMFSDGSFIPGFCLACT